MSNTAPRLITLILLLQNQPNQKAAGLAEKLGVSVRTLHRYLSMLDEMGIPVYSERGPYGGFSLLRGYKMPPLVFTPEEAVAVSLGTGLVEEMWGQLYREAGRGALAKLENVLPDEQRHEVAWARRSLIATGLHRADLEALVGTLEKLRRAARERRRTRMAYLGRGQTEAGERLFDPFALVHRWGWWYTVGFCHLRQAVRTFRVDRIASLALLDEGFDMPPDFDIQAYLDEEQSVQQVVRVKLRFAPPMAAVARENTLGWEKIEEQADGSLVVTLASWEVMWAVSMAMSYGPGVTVIEPVEAVEMARQWARELATNYSEEDGKHE